MSQVIEEGLPLGGEKDGDGKAGGGGDNGGGGSSTGA